MRVSTLLVASTFLVFLGCSTASVTPPPFDGNRAFDDLTKQVSFGPRVPGTAASAACRTYVYESMKALGVVVDSQAFNFFDPYSKSQMHAINIIIHVPGKKTDQPGLVFLAHYDSRPRTDYPSDTSLKDKPIAGANDGASGVAVLMELARLFATQPPPADIDLVLVDAEDWGKEGDTEYYLLGSKYFGSSNIHGRYRFGIVLDMIGDKDQQIYREGFSDQYNKPLDDMIWKTASQLGIHTFIDSVKHIVMDDHLSLNAGGVPSVDLIDFDYPYWHTDQDTPDKCSAESLSNVGRVLAYIAYNPKLWPKK